MTGTNEKEQNQEKIQYTIRFTPSTIEEIEEMAKEEGITKADLIRRALNFYQVSTCGKILGLYRSCKRR